MEKAVPRPIRWPRSLRWPGGPLGVGGRSVRVSDRGGIQCLPYL